MDVVRLAIIYDTNQAANRLNNLNRQLTGVNGNSRKAASAAVGLAQAFATGNVSATALTNRLANLGGKMGTVGLVIAVAAGVLLLFRRNADKAREASQRFADQLRDTRRRVDELLRSDIRSPLSSEIERITDAITDLDRTLARQRMNILQRLFGGLSLKEGVANVKRFLFGGADPTTLQARGDLRQQAERLTTGNLASSMAERSTADLRRIAAFSSLTRGPVADQMANQVKRLEQELEKLLEILPEDSLEVQKTAQELNDLADKARAAARAERLLTSTLETAADALEDFVITGTAAFTDFLNNILRLLYRDVTGELIHGIVRSATGGLGPTGAVIGDVKDISNVPKSGPAPSVTMNVNFSVQAIDAQGTAQFFERNGALIAGEVAKAATKSRAVRRAFQRG